jgi:hypothetical protein
MHVQNNCQYYGFAYLMNDDSICLFWSLALRETDWGKMYFASRPVQYLGQVLVVCTVRIMGRVTL